VTGLRRSSAACRPGGGARPPCRSITISTFLAVSVRPATPASPQHNQHQAQVQHPHSHSPRSCRAARPANWQVSTAVRVLARYRPRTPRPPVDVDRDMVDVNSALGQQLLDVPVRQPVPQIPPHRQRDHLRREPEPGERRSLNHAHGHPPLDACAHSARACPAGGGSPPPERNRAPGTTGQLPGSPRYLNLAANNLLSDVLEGARNVAQQSLVVLVLRVVDPALLKTEIFLSGTL
jgi:hypothetical protein